MFNLNDPILGENPPKQVYFLVDIEYSADHKANKSIPPDSLRLISEPIRTYPECYNIALKTTEQIAGLNENSIVIEETEDEESVIPMFLVCDKAEDIIAIVSILPIDYRHETIH